MLFYVLNRHPVEHDVVAHFGPVFALKKRQDFVDYFLVWFDESDFLLFANQHVHRVQLDSAEAVDEIESGEGLVLNHDGKLIVVFLIKHYLIVIEFLRTIHYKKVMLLAFCRHLKV